MPGGSLLTIDPHLTRKISFVMSLLLAPQSQDKQWEFSSRCTLCGSLNRPDVCHVLFQCTALETTRHTAWEILIKNMPPGLKADFCSCPAEARVELILSCLRGSYIKEWGSIYEDMVKYVSTMYRERTLKLGNVNTSK